MEKPEKQSYRVFIWYGVDQYGNKANGELQALSLSRARVYLRKQGITLKKIRRKPTRFRARKQKITSREITLFTRQLATMVRAGIPLIQSLNVIAEGLENIAMQTVILNIRNEVTDGNMLSTGLRKHPQIFDKLFCNLVEAGEQSGSLDTMLDRLAIYKEKSERIKTRIQKALYYPATVIAISAVVMLILLLKVIPQFESLFNNFNAELPAVTRAVLELSGWVQQGWWLIVSLITLIPLLLIRKYRSSATFAYRFDALMLKLPVIGSILRKSSIARFSRTLATSFTSGVPLVESLTSAAGAAGNRVFIQAIIQARDSISMGQQLNFALKTTQVFPLMVTQMISIGEESGSLDTMLNKVADFYEEEVDDAVENMTSLLEPIVVAVLGVMVGGLVLAMYLPIFKMGSLF